MPVGRWQRYLSTYPEKIKTGNTESPGQDRNTHINEETEKCRSMAAVMLFLLGKERKTEHNTHFCMPLKPVFTRCCGNGVHFTDEPPGALNRASSDEVMDELLSLNRDGTTIMCVTHDSKVAAKCSRVLYIVDGGIVGEKEMGYFGGSDKEFRDRERELNNWLMEQGW